VGGHQTHHDAHQGLDGHAGVSGLAGGGGAVDGVGGQLFQVAEGGDELGDEEVFFVWGESAGGTEGSEARKCLVAWTRYNARGQGCRVKPARRAEHTALGVKLRASQG